ncbi:hypothetical protein GCM10009567_06960 [Rothia amarae]
MLNLWTGSGIINPKETSSNEALTRVILANSNQKRNRLDNLSIEVLEIRYRVYPAYSLRKSSHPDGS